tara:strand:+ start:533 stop:1048 length:516 start_codon:yes stop_codon:yes gene_type:complete
MPTDYEAFYRENPNGLGKPTKEYVSFFDVYGKRNARVLDVECGQGRDALFIGRLGHTVTAVDISRSGVAALVEAAACESLEIDAHIADIRNYRWAGPYDVIVVDRTLHMLPADDRLEMLGALVGATVAGSHLLIADEKRNLPAFAQLLSQSGQEWKPILAKRGFLFVLREK